MLKRNSAAETEIKTTPRLMLITRHHEFGGKKSCEGSCDDKDLHPYLNNEQTRNQTVIGQASVTGDTTHHF